MKSGSTSGTNTVHSIHLTESQVSGNQFISQSNIALKPIFL